ncbi:protein UNUSUAL FLORAL ORGANS-like [Cucumis melo var. makuwa]|uniref:Protein UNUSUAL FLORAL ORGANS-like n=1 Tax=Cucumis melo var. makuwa TaxID=1194695 RepID=A0A5D3BJJ6_CUCMM|nr:protein UNUSUAL FLORAL ORGANS-like [Cucumis melo var. makuwa]
MNFSHHMDMSLHPSMNPTIPFTYNIIPSSNCGIISTTSNNNVALLTTTGPRMDCRIWSKLPQRILDRVVAFLPPPAFFRARCVCKRWYGLLFYASFLELYLQISPYRRHWFLFFKLKGVSSHIYRNNNNSPLAGPDHSRPTYEGYLFDPYDVAWYRLSFAQIPAGFSPVASSGGLICWAPDEGGPKTLILSNPILGTLCQLPPTTRPRLFPSIGFAITPSSIDITVAGDDLISPYAVKNLTAESFHIDATGFYSMWATTSTLPRLCSFESSRMVHVAGRLYSMNYSPFSILAYDMSHNNWWKIQAPMRRFLRSPNLVESQGKLLLIAAVEKSKLNTPKSLRIWGLQSCGTTWIEMQRMPQQLYVQFEELEKSCGFECVAHGEFVMVLIRGCWDKAALLYDMAKKLWQWVPPCPYIGTPGGGHGGEEVLHGFAYEPRLATPVTGLIDHFSIPFQNYTANHQ